jgi:hypothetical protein
MENIKAELRWEPTEFRCLHSLLLSCKKSETSVGFANIVNAHVTISCCYQNSLFFLLLASRNNLTFRCIGES